MASNTTIGQLEITRYVQSTVKIKAGGLVVWIDPFMVNAEHIGEDKADLILLTHEHGDHFSVDTLNAVAKEGTKLLCPNNGVISQIQGSVTASPLALKEGDTTSAAGLDVRAVAGYNDIHPRNNGYDSFNIGYIFGMGGQ